MEGILSERYCRRDTVGEILSEGYCRRDTVGEILSEGYSRRDTVGGILAGTMIPGGEEKERLSPNAVTLLPPE